MWGRRKFHSLEHPTNIKPNFKEHIKLNLFRASVGCLQADYGWKFVGPSAKGIHLEPNVVGFLLRRRNIFQGLRLQQKNSK